MGNTEPRTFHDELTASDMRIAVYPELGLTQFVLECRICGRVELLINGSDIAARCGGCNLSCRQGTLRFWVLLPKSVPPPEEEG